MSDYSSTITAIIEQAKIREDALPLRNEYCRSRFFFHPHPTKKVFLFFHGFTAGPYQFEPLGKAFFQLGYNVLIPLLPGHGIAGDWNDENPPPLPEDVKFYQRFALDWLQVAKLLGDEIIIGGESSGATLSAWLALERRQEISKALLFAAYLGSNFRMINWLVSVLPFYYEWLNKDNPGNYGYDGFQIPALRLFLDLGQEILDRVENTPASPMLIVSSEADKAVNISEHQDLFKAVIKYQPKSWYYCFDQKLNIPHTMMTEAEGNEYLDLLITISKAYVESEVTWGELQKIAQFMLKGVNFGTVVNKLNLDRQISGDLRVMMETSDRQSIVECAF